VRVKVFSNKEEGVWAWTRVVAALLETAWATEDAKGTVCEQQRKARDIKGLWANPCLAKLNTIAS